MDNTLSNLFRELARTHRTAVQEYLDNFDLFIGQPRFLFELEERPGITQKELVDALHVSKETVSITLSRLENAGFIQRVVTENDRRKKSLFLSAKGEKVVEQLHTDFNMINNLMFVNLSENEKLVLEELFEKMILGLKERSR
ncbi:MarR family transcriptional regulator [Erysipelothrix inopinata]|uniref:MarR family transcriptional regulator n=1 Tax=Erysipelothrix inopinata TaxID=225084 RepID=A0A7G9RWZ3_9FIRM|nr:MarR family transcriptional regulator [Erysipelothrix inopinata]QNN60118.1 MarR family transcriptional regulator [Erysipelothrix inopinata]